MPRKAYIDGPFGQLHYLVEGSGPTLVLLHQMVQSSLQFQPALPHLAARGLRAVAVDMPGYGMSDGPQEPPSAEDYAQVVPALLDHLEVDRAIVCGHHTGATVAVACAHRYPERVSKLILHGTPFFNVEERAQRLARPHLNVALSEDGSHLKTLWDKLRGLTDGKASLEITNWTVLLRYLAGDNDWYGHNAVYTYDMAPALAALAIPVRVISNRGDMIHPFDKRVIEARPDFDYVEMTEAGTYQVIFDAPETWAALVADFAQSN